MFLVFNLRSIKITGQPSFNTIFGVRSIYRFKEVASKSKDDLVALGFPEFTIEDFHETVGPIH